MEPSRVKEAEMGEGHGDVTSYTKWHQSRRHGSCCKPRSWRHAQPRLSTSSITGSLSVKPGQWPHTVHKHWTRRFIPSPYVRSLSRCVRRSTALEGVCCSCMLLHVLLQAVDAVYDDIRALPGFLPRCLTSENILCDVDENWWQQRCCPTELFGLWIWNFFDCDLTAANARLIWFNNLKERPTFNFVSLISEIFLFVLPFLKPCTFVECICSLINWLNFANAYAVLQNATEFASCNNDS